MTPRKLYTDADLTPFGKRLKDAYEKSGYTQTSFERACGFGKGYLTRLLYEPTLRAITFDNIETIELLTGVRIQWLARGELPMREIEPVAPMKKAAALARSEGVPEDIIAHVCRRNATQAWDTPEWYRAFRDANRKVAEDDSYRRELRRVTMDTAFDVRTKRRSSGE